MNSIIRKIIIFIIVLFFCIHFHTNIADQNKEFDRIYSELKNNNRQYAINKFLQLGEGASVYLIGKIENEKDLELKIEILKLIAAIGCDNCEDKLLSLTNSEEAIVRFHTIDVLMAINYQKLPDLLITLIKNDDDIVVKCRAILTLRNFKNANYTNFVLNLMKEKKYKNEVLIKAINYYLSDTEIDNG